jgi:fucose 4-O-acetylase-like acetyltransferase
MKEVSMKDRDCWVDYGRALGIVLVVYGHVVRGLLAAGIIDDPYLHQLVDSLIYSFHMPLFFFLSGLYFWDSKSKRGAGGLVVSKVDTLFYPFLLWSILQGSIEVLLSQYANSDIGFAKVFSLLWAPRAQFWFLYTLFLIFILAVLLYRRRELFLPLLLAGGLVYVLQRHFPDLFALDFVVQNLVFFALGVWFNNIRDAVESRAVTVAILSGLAFVALEYWFHGVLGMRYEERSAASLLVAMIAILFVVSGCMVLARKPLGWVLTLGALSMPIYLMHILAGSGTRVILSKFLGIESVGLHIVAGCVSGLLLPVIAAKILEAMGIKWLYEAPAWMSLDKRRQRRLAMTPGTL